MGDALVVGVVDGWVLPGAFDGELHENAERAVGGAAGLGGEDEFAGLAGGVDGDAGAGADFDGDHAPGEVADRLDDRADGWFPGGGRWSGEDRRRCG